MLDQISWGSYLTAVLIILLCYYAAVALLYYRHEIKTFLLSLKNKSSEPTRPETVPGAGTQGIFHFEDLQNTIQDIDSILEEAGEEAGKEELLLRLRQRLASCDGLRHPAYRVAVFNHIINRTKQKGGDRISEQDLEMGLAG